MGADVLESINITLYDRTEMQVKKNDDSEIARDICKIDV